MPQTPTHPFVLSTPQAGPSGCEHPPAPPLHTTCPFTSLTFTSSQSPSPVDPASLSSAFPSPHTGPRTTTSLDLPGMERGWGRKEREPPEAEQALRAGAPAQLHTLPGGKVFLWPEGFQRGWVCCQTCSLGPSVLLKCLKEVVQATNSESVDR